MRLAQIALCALSLLVPTAAFATAPVSITILVCEFRDSLLTPLQLPVYSYVADFAANTPRFVGVYTDGRLFGDLLVDAFRGTIFSACYLKNNPDVRFRSLTIEDVSAVGAVSGTAVESNGNTLVDGARFYTGLTLSYNSVAVELAVIVPPREITPEEKAKALEAFKARMPLPKD